jgi:hypothetical protein
VSSYDINGAPPISPEDKSYIAEQLMPFFDSDFYHEMTDDRLSKTAAQVKKLNDDDGY